jgi:hypothetical protein
MKIDINDLPSTVLTVCAWFPSGSSRTAKRFKKECKKVLFLRGQMVPSNKRVESGDRWTLSSGVRDKLYAQFGEPEIDRSQEDLFFENVLRYENPWKQFWSGGRMPKSGEMEAYISANKISSTNLAIYTFMTVPDSNDEDQSKEMRVMCIHHLEKRGHLVRGGEGGCDWQWTLPPEDHEKLAQWFGLTGRAESLEDYLFTQVLHMPNPWRRKWNEEGLAQAVDGPNEQKRSEEQS